MTKFIVALSLVLFAANSALAVETQFMLQQDVLTYSSNNTTTKIGSADANKAKENTLTTLPNSLTVGITVEKFNLYIFPTQVNLPVGLSYYFLESLEIGLSLAFNSSTIDKPKSENTTNLYGLFATYYLDLGNYSIEFTPGYQLISGKQLSTDANDKTITTTTTTSGNQVGLDITFVLPITRNFSWLAGVNYGMTAAERESKIDDIAIKTKVSTTGYKLKLSGVRVNF